MTRRSWKDSTERRASLRVSQVKSCTMLATLTLALNLVPIAASQTASEPLQEQKQLQEKMTADQKQAAAFGRATEVEREVWRKRILRTPRPNQGKGCYEARYPETVWHEVQCEKPSNKLYLPKRPGMVRPETVGAGGPDFSAVVTGFITEAEGSFDSVTGVTGECAVQCPNQVCPANPSCTGAPANEYSLQLNSKPFNTSTCAGSQPVAGHSCVGWEQWVYPSSGGGSIQYWLEFYGPAGTACPKPRGAACVAGFASTDGWCPFQFTSTGPVYCVVNAANSAGASAEPATSLGAIKLTGAAAGVNGNADDSVTVTISGVARSASGGNYFPDLGTQWQEAEFNVFGDGNGDQAVFNSGANVAVRTGVTSGTSLGPNCDDQSFTGESNNLTLVNTPPPAVKGNMPALLFSESNPPPAGGAATCADATSVGDTHLTTFDGLYYDFQASGDFVLAQDGHDFIVQGRQASGAPTWPNAAVNKAIATQMGKTRVAVYIEPARLVIDGASTDLADGKSILLPSGVQVSRQGNVYTISSLSGDRVRATLNSTWIDVKVGLGVSPRPQVQGLLGNPLGNAQDLFTSNGVVLTAPVQFRDLYGPYAESWRVPPERSLFTEETRIKFGTPSKPFYASDLTQQQSARARAACNKAGIKNWALLDSCILDTTVLNDETAVKVFVHLPPPRHIITPGHKGRDHDCDCDKDDREHGHDRDHDRNRE